MHQGNLEWLAHVQKRFGLRWRGGSILELGAYDYNGSARQHLISRRYVGVDQQEGPGVDVVSAANATSFGPHDFDCMLCTSMLEHDPTWRASLDHNLQWLAPDAIVLLSWGAEGNEHHAPEPWAPVPVGDVLEWIAARPFVILEAYWERSRFTADATGCYDIVLCYKGVN